VSSSYIYKSIDNEDLLKGTLKTKLEVLYAGTPVIEGKPKKTLTPRKRKDTEANSDAKASPTTRGRKKKGSEPAPEPAEDDNEKISIKPEVEDVV
jgi:hypothetical protein